MTDIPSVQIENYDEPEEKGVHEVEMWEVFSHVEWPQWGLHICVHHCDSTGIPYAASLKHPDRGNQCMHNNNPVVVVGRVVFG